MLVVDGERVVDFLCLREGNIRFVGVEGHVENSLGETWNEHGSALVKLRGMYELTGQDRGLGLVAR